MSFDIYFQGFYDGDAGSGGGEQMRRVLQPHVSREEPQVNFLLVEYGDGAADVYLDGDHMMVNHVSGIAPWDLLVEGAREAGWVILPTGCSTCITDQAQRDHLPEGLEDDVVLVRSGEELLNVIEAR